MSSTTRKTIKRKSPEEVETRIPMQQALEELFFQKGEGCDFEVEDFLDTLDDLYREYKDTDDSYTTLRDLLVNLEDLPQHLWLPVIQCRKRGTEALRTLMTICAKAYENPKKAKVEPPSNEKDSKTEVQKVSTGLTLHYYLFRPASALVAAYMMHHIHVIDPMSKPLQPDSEEIPPNLRDEWKRMDAESQSICFQSSRDCAQLKQILLHHSEREHVDLEESIASIQQIQ